MIERFHSINTNHSSEVTQVSKVIKLLSWISLFFLTFGGILFFINANDFSSTNTGLMASIGMIIFGLQIFGTRTVMFYSIQRATEEDETKNALKTITFLSSTSLLFLIFGGAMFLLHANNFSAENVELMASVSLMTLGLQIFGTNMVLLHSLPNEEFNQA